MKPEIDNNEEQVLINALTGGDESAFRQVINKYRAPLIRLCRGFTGSADDAEDLAQEVFIEVFRSIKRFKSRSSLSTWIYRIAVNKSLNFIRDKKISYHHDPASAEDTDISEGGDNAAEKRLIQSEHAAALHKAIDSLPEGQRTAFVLSKYEEMTYAGIAEIMKTSVSSVESLLFRAKRNLQDKLYDYYKENLK